MVTIEEFYECWKQLENIDKTTPPPLFWDIWWSIAQEKKLHAIFGQRYEDLKVCLRMEFDTLKHDKRFEDLFFIAVKMAILELTGLDNGSYKEDWYKPYFFIAPIDADIIIQLGELYEDSLVDMAFKHMNITKTFISKVEIKKIIRDMINNPETFDFEMTKYNKKYEYDDF